jgi:hypothetical protein
MACRAEDNERSTPVDTPKGGHGRGRRLRDDVDVLVTVDPRDPSRYIAVGFSGVARVLVVVRVARSERTRLIFGAAC